MDKSLEPPERTISVRVSLAARLLRKRYDERARIFGLTRAQWNVIGAVRYKPGITQRELAELIEIGSVTTCRLVDRIERDGWIERRSDPLDRRVHRLYASPNAGHLYDQMAQLGKDEEEQALAGLDQAERAVLSDALDTLIGNLSKPSAAGDVNDAG